VKVESFNNDLIIERESLADKVSARISIATVTTLERRWFSAWKQYSAGIR
jgi:hypothetical protein